MMTRILLPALALSVALSACKDDASDANAGNKPGNQKPAPKPADPPQPPGEPPTSDPKLKVHMKAHFAAVRDIQNAIIHNNLDAAKSRADLLAKHEPSEKLAGWEAHVEAMREAARKLAAAEDTATAAKLAAQLGGECGGCHEAMTAIATFEWAERPSPEGDAKAHMALHKWAADRLWEGLVGPSQSHWVLGAEAFANEPLHAGEINKDAKVTPEVEALAQKVHELGRRAATITEPAGRVEIYGELLEACSGCHKATRK